MLLQDFNNVFRIPMLFPYGTHSVRHTVYGPTSYFRFR